MANIDRDIRTVTRMIHIYCRHKEGNAELCSRCAELLDYSVKRLSKCPFGADKTSCRKCRVHCYSPDMKVRIKEVMRYAGPRMIIYHPVAAIRHIFSEITIINRGCRAGFRGR